MCARVVEEALRGDRHMAAEVGKKAPEFSLPTDSWDKEGVVRAKRVEESPRDQPEVEAVLDDLEKAL